ncbi:helix-turn-helix protein [Krasilnikovia cinnamomea]|uniref:Helix-turn-helix protein n=1 Tax=Krasilnikovia cinnamomea TaxID=349313 RepID=A0A4Q7ZEI5_9ACTN|nr:helix-turn-helix transcriptional regulator [Krasilnikovia cinnamomea]RZU48485.1 helix-turn-helix protein [Krasilnikovia cinnamomea]
MTSEPTSFGLRLRQFRQRRGLSVRQLAALSRYGKSYVHDLETGRRVPNPAVARRLDEALDAGGGLVHLAAPHTEPALVHALTLPVAASPADQPMTDEHVQQLHETVKHLVALDTLHGSESLYATAVRAFRNAHRRLATAGAEQAARSDLQVVIAEVGEVAAWLAYDSEHQDISRQIANEAMLIARMAGDSSMQRFLLSHLSMQATYLERGSEALDLANRVIAERPRSRRVVGMMRVRRARALGQLGDGTRALAELQRASGELAGGVGPNDPAWSWWLHSAELAVHEARIRSAAGDGRGSVAASERSVRELPAGQGRDQALYRAWLVSDLVDVGAWRDAGEVAEQLIARSAVAGSARVPRILRRAERRAGRAGAPMWLVDAVREAGEASAPAA